MGSLSNWLGSLPKRDLFILPIISVATIGVLLFVCEIGARWIWPEVEIDSCGFHDPAGMLRFRPNCESFTKAFDTALVSNDYNECGYRSPDPCSPKAAGQLRVAVIGTSFSYGQYEPYPHTFAGYTSKRLRELCDSPANFQILAAPGLNVSEVYREVEEALPLRPDAFIMAISDYDVLHVQLEAPAPANAAADRDAAATPQSLRQLVMKEIENSRFLAVMRLYRSLDMQHNLELRLNSERDNSDFFRTPLSPLWGARLQKLEEILGRAKSLADSNGIPFIMVLVPSKTMIALTLPEFARPGIDPHQPGRLLGDIAKRHGIVFADATDEFATIPAIDSLIYPWNGHPTARGHAILANIFLNALLDQSAFAGCSKAASAAARATASTEGLDR